MLYNLLMVLNLSAAYGMKQEAEKEGISARFSFGIFSN